jgi:hypothetical protein
MDWFLIAALVVWALVVWWAIADSVKQDEREKKERKLIMESYRDHERR